jgi:hypothetical protein
VWHVPLAQVLPRPQLIFPFKNLLFWNLFEFSAAEITYKINISHTFWIHRNFQLWFNLIFSENTIQYSKKIALQVQKTLWNSAHAAPLLLVKSFPKTPRTWSKASRFDGSHNYSSLLPKYSTWTWEESAYLAGRCALKTNHFF